MTTLVIEHLPVSSLKPYARNARTHSKKQIRQIADSIERFGFTNPVLISDDHEIIAGHGRVSAAKLLGLDTVPTVKLSHLSEAERRAYVIADNKLALNAGWDSEMLAIELQALVDLDFDVGLTGFSLAEIDLVLDGAAEADPAAKQSNEDRVEPCAAAAVTRRGDLWLLGRHRLLCGDAREPEDYGRPPRSGRFKPGQSGNPRGRPKRKRPDYRNGFGLQWSRELMLDEAYRTVTLRENGQTIVLPALQAAFRGALIQAAKGSRLHLKLVMDSVGQIERDDRNDKIDLFKKALDGKRQWAADCEQASLEGKPQPKPPMPHPDDVLIDADTAEVRIVGPRTAEELERVDRLVAYRDALVKVLHAMDAQYGNGPFEADDEVELVNIRQTLEAMDQALPPRLRRSRGDE